MEGLLWSLVSQASSGTEVDEIDTDHKVVGVVLDL